MISRLPRLSILLCMALLLGAGCVEERSAGAHASLPMWSATEELVIGDSSDVNHRFLEPSSLHPTGSGGILTLHVKERRLRMFDDAGRFVRDIAGPDDLAGPLAMGVRGDTAWVLDRLLRTEFRLFRISDGAHIETLIASEASGFGSAADPRRFVAAVGILPDGSYLTELYAGARDHVTGRIRDRVFLRTARDGLVLDTLAVLSAERTVIGFLGRDGEGGVFGAQPFSDDPLFAASPVAAVVFVLDRRVEALDGSNRMPHFRLRGHTYAGKQLLERSYAYRPNPIPRRWVDQNVRSWQQELGMAYSRSEPLIRERLFVPAHQPAIAEMHIGVDGRIWLRTWDLAAVSADYGLTQGVPELSVWLVLSAAGEIQGRLELLARVRWLHADDQALWGTYTHPREGGKIVRYGIRTSGE
jgi:hypothetical protein